MVNANNIERALARGRLQECRCNGKASFRSKANVTLAMIVVVAADFIVLIFIIDTIIRQFLLRIGNRFMSSYFHFSLLTSLLLFAAADVEHHVEQSMMVYLEL